MKRKNSILLGSVLLLYIGLVGSGTLFAKSPVGFTGLGAFKDISPDDETLVFTHFQDDQASLYIRRLNGESVELLAQPENGSYTKPKFSNNGEKILFIHEIHNEEEHPKGRLMLMNRDGSNQKALTSYSTLVTEAVFGPKDENIYFLMAGVYRSYSPIASKHPHDFNIFAYDLNKEEYKAITQEDAYSMQSLDITSDGKHVTYISFEEKSKLYYLDLDTKSKKRYDPEGTYGSNNNHDIARARLSPDDQQLALTSVAGETENGTFMYEIFLHDRETKQTKQLTSFGENVSDAVFLHDQDKLLVAVNQNWPKRDPNFLYALVDLKSGKSHPISIDMNSPN